MLYVSQARRRRKTSELYDLLLYLPITPTMFRDYYLFIYYDMLLKTNLLQSDI